MLQWGRGCSAAERTATDPVFLEYMTLQWGRGCSAAESRPRGIGRKYWAGRFNGAAAVQPRKDAIGLHVRAGRQASMGPRLFSRGKMRQGCPVVLDEMLQWGRGCSAAERRRDAFRRRDGPSGFNGAAAVQPRKGGGCLQARDDATKASMGPRLFSRGKRSACDNITAALALQWGRGCSAAESTSRAPPLPRANGLQWGRGCSAAERTRF